jgi:hypothetical protein
MKKNNRFQVIVLPALLVSFFSIAGCDNGEDKSKAAEPVFSDNFDSYALEIPWTLEGGWTTTDTADWAIVAGLSGNGVQKVTTGSAYLTSPYTGTDYTVSVRVRPTAIVDDWDFGISARDDGNNNRYCAFLEDNTSIPETTICIFKFWDNGSTGGCRVKETFIAADLNTSKYYTLKLKISGAVITATVTDGSNSHTVTWTDPDDVPSNGALITSGSAGLFVYSSLEYPVIYDNFTVTEP